MATAPATMPLAHRIVENAQKSYGGNATVYVYDVFGRLVSEYLNGAWSRDLIAEGGGELIATENASGPRTTCYFGTDHLGSVRIVTDQNANVVARHDYLPFGEELLLGAAGRTTQGFNVTSDVTQKFTGQIRDQESGEDFFNARYFTAPLGRFNSPDPMNAGASLLSSQSWNGYGYVLGNPLASTDPSGACSIKGDATAATDDPGEPCVAPGSTSATVDGGAPDDVTVNSTSPWQLGWQWFTGGQKKQIFTQNDSTTLLLREHKHIQNVKQSICNQLKQRQVPPPNVPANYSLGGVQGIPKYFGDYSTLVTGGAAGNLAVTYLGSYALTYNVDGFDMSAGTASVQFHVSNTSNLASATHPPLAGYTQWWNQHVAPQINNLVGSTGAFSPTQQEFYWTEALNGCQAQ